MKVVHILTERPFCVNAACKPWGKHVAVFVQAWPKEDENTKDEEAVLSGKTRSRRQPKEELSDEVRCSVSPLLNHRGVLPMRRVC